MLNNNDNHSAPRVAEKRMEGANCGKGNFTDAGQQGKYHCQKPKDS